ncbi:MAG: 1-acyl-sn-glycerol-3-phosphate acyltransferase [Sphingobacteriales bacterium]|nr:MAG: 1-acyl-sn-glycerol-3-phosphate acyltransferase [Sphingobacteriales bacterium]TAF81880.1 MAG: 1-acyl-sn-glycerol-3-phosphate acyltransferase [Sphingobacteriales bacterium]
MILRRFFSILFSPIHHLFFGLTLCVFQPIQWLSLKLGGYSTHKKSVDLLNFFLVCTYYLLGLRVSFKGNKKLPLGKSIIFVSNHQSMYDVPALIWFLRKYHAKFISKIELTKNIPSISFNLKNGGGANINRKDARQAISEILKLGERMRDKNWSVVIFPEGTRAKNGKLKDFQAGGVATLLKKVPQALVVPIAINNSWKVVQNGSILLMPGYHLLFTVLDAIDTESKTADEILIEAKEAIGKVVY